jgi:hypothetical protein
VVLAGHSEEGSQGNECLLVSAVVFADALEFITGDFAGGGAALVLGFGIREITSANSAIGVVSGAAYNP